MFTFWIEDEAIHNRPKSIDQNHPQRQLKLFTTCLDNPCKEIIISLKVRSWLENIFGDEAVPAFEINTKTIEILSSLMDINEQKDHSTRLVIEDLEQKKKEYISEGELHYC